MNQSYSHSITLDLDKCQGCTNCIKRCPTEAIRVINGQAHILQDRCIDCGQCVRICPFQAKHAYSDPFESIKSYKQTVALVAPSFYGQFPGNIGINQILTAVKSLGFTDVLEVAQGADLAARGAERYLQEPHEERPPITSSCPVVVRLIQTRFPSLLDNLIPLISPMEITARIARTMYPQAGTGVFFISPCPGKVTAVKNPRGIAQSSLNGVIGFRDIYGRVKSALNKMDIPENLASAPSSGRRWARVGGEGEDSSKHFISIDGIDRVMEGLEQIENGEWSRFDLVEFMCCPGGCMGGPLTVINPYEAAANIKERELLSDPDEEELRKLTFPPLNLEWETLVEPMPVYRLNENYEIAVQLMEEMEIIFKQLPGIDCGSCGAPSCRSFAEDVTMGRAKMTDCVFLLREKIKGLTREMVNLQKVMPPSFKKKHKGK
jgi:Na+-translocating ferredoxin:NAD+ oxidoreductase RNF subunit RnfB